MADIGGEVGSAALKDIILPGEMRDMMNRVVAAEKQAQANLIRRREETAETRSLLNTAKLMEENPLLIRMKEFEMLEKLAGKVERISLMGGFDGLLTNLLSPFAKGIPVGSQGEERHLAILLPHQTKYLRPTIDNPKASSPAAQGTIWLLTISVACIVANIYYAQPLLADIARSFNLTVAKVGSVAMLMQIGTAFGMLIFVPLGDSHERRALITVLLVAASISLAFIAAAPSALWLCVAGFCVGATGATVHVIVPLAAHLAPEGQRGRVVGLVLSGLLIGILLARTLSGFLGAHLGWRAVYWFAAVLMLGLAALIRLRLPESRPEIAPGWKELMRSIVSLVRQHAELRESALLGALFFCAFSAFWTTLVFLLSTPPYHYGSSVAGSFGLIGAAGAAGAPLIGRLSDRQGPRRTILWALLTTIFAYGILALLGRHMIGLVVGVVLLDLGVQSGHVANQTRIYGLAPNARSRLNTAYMVSYFIGGALGSSGGAVCWKYAGWPGVCIFSIFVLILALVVWVQGGSRHALTASRRTI